jgi:hypothetical protein
LTGFSGPISARRLIPLLGSGNRQLNLSIANFSCVDRFIVASNPSTNPFRTFPRRSHTNPIFEVKQQPIFKPRIAER